MLLLMTAATLLLFGSGAYKYWVKDRELESLRSQLLHVWETNRQVHRTLATGLYGRFRQEGEDLADADAKEISSVYIRSNPYELAYFVAEILEGTYGGQAYVTQSAEPGVDIEHERKDGLYLVQVRCSRRDTDAEAVALLHSQVMRRKARGGWIVSTGGLTEAAKRYADETDLVWVDGIRLVQLWGEHLEQLEHKGRPEEGIRDTCRPATT